MDNWPRLEQTAFVIVILLAGVIAPALWLKGITADWAPLETILYVLLWIPASILGIMAPLGFTWLLIKKHIPKH